MASLEDLQPNASVRGILPDCLVTIVGVRRFGSEALELTFKDPAGQVGNQLISRLDEQRLTIVEHGRPWSLDGDDLDFRLDFEARRIRLARLFDPVLAEDPSVVDPPQCLLTAAYEMELSRKPLRVLHVDDPGLGKTFVVHWFGVNRFATSVMETRVGTGDPW